MDRPSKSGLDSASAIISSFVDERADCENVDLPGTNAAAMPRHNARTTARMLLVQRDFDLNKVRGSQEGLMHTATRCYLKFTLPPEAKEECLGSRQCRFASCMLSDDFTSLQEGTQIPTPTWRQAMNKTLILFACLPYRQHSDIRISVSERGGGLCAIVQPLPRVWCLQHISNARCCCRFTTLHSVYAVEATT